MVDLVVLGASGSLSKKMITPAIETLLKKRSEIRLVGWGRSDRPSWWRWEYVQNDYGKLDEYKFGQKTIIYLALPIKIDIIKQIMTGLKKINIDKKDWKIAIEKPFGGNFKEARAIKNELEKVFSSIQIFPVDHYLTKDLVKNIISFRFANPIIEQIWIASNIEKIRVTAWEKEDVADRAGYYDQFGAIKDMIQNHLLSVLLLLTIDRPKCVSGICLSQAKIKQIRKIKIVGLETGQYKGYEQELGVNIASKTETMARVKLKINSKKWMNVPITLETGKKLKEKLTEAEIVFKNKNKCLWQDKCSLLKNNRIVINLYPNNEIQIYLNHGTKIEQELPESVPLKLSSVDIYRNEKSPYEEILENIVDGSKINFANFSEIVEAWKVVEKIDKLKLKTKLKIY